MEEKFKEIEVLERAIVNRRFLELSNNKPEFIRQTLNNLDSFKEDKTEIINDILQDWWFNNSQSVQMLKDIVIEVINRYYHIVEEESNKIINNIIK